MLSTHWRIAVVILVTAGLGLVFLAFTQFGQQKPVFAHEEIQNGIEISGHSSITMLPDIALLGISVSTTTATTAEAREVVAVAVNAVLAALESLEIAEEDIQTQAFQIETQHDWIYLEQNGARISTKVIAGYTVTSEMAVKVRDVDELGTVVDDTAAAAPDMVSFNGPLLQVEDVSAIEDRLRKAAVEDAKKKAEQFADWAGVELRQVTHLRSGGIRTTEYGDWRYDSYGVSLAATVESAEAPTPTTINLGQLKATFSVHMTFAIR